MQSILSKSGVRSKCPINAVVEVIGDQWTLLILRDMLLLSWARFSEFRQADEGVATNILATRLKHLVDQGLVEKHRDPLDGRGALYLPTERAFDLIPLLLAALSWSDAHQPDTAQYPEIVALYRSDPQAAVSRLKQRALQFRKEVLP